ncbi:MAG: hypothetical protein DMD96_22190 [Candidatus Rokuibacteriota bacterium]|nr:MAG: hypothetical protein DMD96_22190 [Candidatus Rokubacteria bacterium]
MIRCEDGARHARAGARSPERQEHGGDDARKSDHGSAHSPPRRPGPGSRRRGQGDDQSQASGEPPDRSPCPHRGRAQARWPPGLPRQCGGAGQDGSPPAEHGASATGSGGTDESTVGKLAGTERPRAAEAPGVSVWIVPLVVIALTQTAVIATSVYLHRTLAHRALAVHPLADLLFRIVLWLTTGQRRQEWVAVHRKHHAFTDREGDPHSPRLLGLWRVQLLNAYYYQREARNRDTIRKFAPDLAEDRLDRAVFSKGIVGPGLGTALLCLLLGIGPGLIAALAHAVLYVVVLAPLINGVGHWRGAQNFTNTAYNSAVLAWVTGGESLHNNHHAEPRAPKFSVRRIEFDPSWLVIRALAAVKLVVVVGPPLRLSADSRAIR